MIQQKDRPLRSASLQRGEHVSPTRRGFEDLAGDGFPFEDLFKKIGAFDLVSGRVDGFDPEIFSKILNGFFQDLIPVHSASPFSAKREMVIDQ
jgi:hypothetical protein